jgi:hypothetical protein
MLHSFPHPKHLKRLFYFLSFGVHKRDSGLCFLFGRAPFDEFY